VFKILKQKEDLKIVILVPNAIKDFFENNYRSDNVMVEGIDLAPFSNFRSNNFFSKAAFLFIYSQWTKGKRWSYVMQNPSIYNYLRCYFLIAVTFLLSGHKTINRIFRFFNQHFSPDNFYKYYFEKYKPYLVFVPDVYTDFDQALIKEAKKNNIPVIGMIRSWDNNTSKGLMRSFPDKLIVNNEVIKKEAEELHDYPEKDIFIGGLPQFDDYLKAPFKSREEFFKSMGGDPEKRTILFSPGWQEISATNTVICRAFKIAKESGILPKDVQFFVRNPPTRPDNTLKERFKNDPDFIVETPGVIKGSGKFLEFSLQDNRHLIDTVYYSDVVIWIATSIGLDSLVFDKPQIAIYFDGHKPKPYWSSIRRYHDEDHYQPFFRTGAVKLANSPDHLIACIKEYLENPSINREGRKKAVSQQLWKVDGKSSERIANFILKY
jgi:hypothetical protein